VIGFEYVKGNFRCGKVFPTDETDELNGEVDIHFYIYI
jgi:hypothetical protein